MQKNVKKFRAELEAKREKKSKQSILNFRQKVIFVISGLDQDLPPDEVVFRSPELQRQRDLHRCHQTSGWLALNRYQQ